MATKPEASSISSKSDGTSSTGSMSALTGSTGGSSSNNNNYTQLKRLKGNPRWNQAQKPVPTTIHETFKEVNESLKGKVFVVGPNQASRYDDALKALIGYLSSKYDHRVKSYIQHKDKAVGVKLLIKPQAPMKVDPQDTMGQVLDKDGEDWVIYQLKLKT